MQALVFRLRKGLGNAGAFRASALQEHSVGWEESRDSVGLQMELGNGARRYVSFRSNNPGEEA